jgi:hypothetical protein
VHTGVVAAKTKKRKRLLTTEDAEITEKALCVPCGEKKNGGLSAAAPDTE